MKKICTKCGKEKNFDSFYTKRGGKYGLDSQCKDCRKAYYKSNKQHKKEYDKKYRKTNKEKISNYLKDYYKQNKEKLLVYQKEYNVIHRKKVSKRSKKYREQNKDIISLNKKNYYKEKAKYETYKDKLTIDESPRLSKDGVSLEIKCRYCGRYFIPTNQQSSDRAKALKNNFSENSLYCSDGCKKSCPVYKQQKYPKGFKKATSREVQPMLRQMVLERDYYTCRKCGKTIDEIELHCHHILPINESPIESADVDNCITLCKECHKKAHKIPNCAYNELKCNKEN